MSAPADGYAQQLAAAEFERLTGERPNRCIASMHDMGDSARAWVCEMESASYRVVLQAKVQRKVTVVDIRAE